MNELWPIITSVLAVFLVMGVGALCRRRGWLTPEADRTLANLTANVFLPAYFVHKILDSQEFEAFSSAWAPPAFGFGLTAFGFGMALLFARTIGPKVGLDSDAKQRAFALCVGICNYGYIPLPLAEQFYPDAEIELILHNVGVDLALWSIGIAIVSGGAGNWKRAVLSPPFIAVIIAFALRQFGGVDLVPGPIFKAIGKMGSCAIPLGLLLSGAIIVDFLRGSNWSGSLPVIVSSIGIRQVVMPAIMLLIAGVLAPSADLKQVIMLQAAMPAAVFPIVLVRLFDRDTETALRVVVATSLAAIVLIPVWLALGTWWLAL